MPTGKVYSFVGLVLIHGIYSVKCNLPSNNFMNTPLFHLELDISRFVAYYIHGDEQNFGAMISAMLVKEMFFCFDKLLGHNHYCFLQSLSKCIHCHIFSVLLKYLKRESIIH